MTENNFPRVSKEAIVKPEDEKPLKSTMKPEEVKSNDEEDYERMKSADNDMDSDDNSDFDPEV